MIQKPDGTEAFSIQQTTYNFLQEIKRKLAQDDTEYWIGVFGNTGVGKSLLAQRWGFVIDEQINIEHVCFDKKEFVKAIVECKKGSVIIADEAISIFFNRSAMTKDSRVVMELINQIRQKNLCVIMCLPNALTADSLILPKLSAAINVYETKNKLTDGTRTIKGNVQAFVNAKNYNHCEKYINILRAKKKNPYLRMKLHPTFQEKGGGIGGNCVIPWYPVGEIAYKAKKEGVLKKYLEPEVAEKKETPYQIALKDKSNFKIGKLISLLLEKEPKKMTQAELGLAINIDASRVSQYLVQYGSLPREINE